MSALFVTLKKYSSKFRPTNEATVKLFVNLEGDTTEATWAVFILGAQRSGTTMLLNALAKHRDCETYGEKSEAMHKYRLEPIADVRRRLERSRKHLVVFKPLTESHRATELLEIPSARVIWCYRLPRDRAKSAVARFGSNNLEVLRSIAAGEQLDAWQAQGLNSSLLSLIRSQDYETMSPLDAAKLFWFVRNRLFFTQKLDLQDKVLPIAYEDMCITPAPAFATICRFLNITYRRRMVRGIKRREFDFEMSGDDTLESDCEILYHALHAIQQRQFVNYRASANVS